MLSMKMASHAPCMRYHCQILGKSHENFSKKELSRKCTISAKRNFVKFRLYLAQIRLIFAKIEKCIFVSILFTTHHLLKGTLSRDF
jgi:hypothetical protein